PPPRSTPPPPPCLALFSLLTRRPPRPTLFPYTTLFRSAWRAGCARGAPDGRRRRRRVPRLHRRHPRPDGPGGRGRPGAARRADEDRKSTRLNSSHVKISYAVFCLKKKNKRTGREDHS